MNYFSTKAARATFSLHIKQLVLFQVPQLGTAEYFSPEVCYRKKSRKELLTIEKDIQEKDQATSQNVGWRAGL